MSWMRSGFKLVCTTFIGWIYCSSLGLGTLCWRFFLFSV